MSDISVPYGKTQMKASLPEQCVIDVIGPVKIAPPTNNIQEIVRALEHPVQPVNEKKLRNASSVAVVISDITRPVPNKLILPKLFEWIERIGGAKSKKSVIIANGLHRETTEEEISMLADRELLKRYNYKIYNHRADRNSDLVFMGYSPRKIPIYVNRIYAESDYRISVGMIEPHQFIGYTGGAKGVVIGLGGKDTIDAHHKLLLDEKARAGVLEGNPARAEIDIMGGIIGVDYIFNVILDGEKRMLKAVSGDALGAFRIGADYSSNMTRVKIGRLYDLVIASPGGYPKDANLYQAQKALYHGQLAAKEGGTIILVTSAVEGAGDEKFYNKMLSFNNPEDIINDFKSVPFEVGVHKAYLWARTLVRNRTILVSRDLSGHLAEQMMVEHVNTLSEAIKLALLEKHNNPSIAVLPFALSVVPVFDEE
jgi:lactate racemase